MYTKFIQTTVAGMLFLAVNSYAASDVPLPGSDPLLDQTENRTPIRTTENHLVDGVSVGKMEPTLINTSYIASDVNTLRRAIPHLSDAADPADRREAIDALRAAGDTGLTMLLEDGLYNSIPSVRTRSVELLATLGGTRVLKPLIEAFYSAANATIPQYQANYVQMLTAQISRLTSQDFYFYTNRATHAPEVAAEVVTWWNANSERFPQLGETALEAKNPRQLRALVLIHRDFGGANLPQVNATTPPVTSPDAQAILNTVNGIPRESDSSFTNRLNPAQEPSVPKIPDEALSAPGKWRDEQQRERQKEMESR